MSNKKKRRFSSKRKRIVHMWIMKINTPVWLIFKIKSVLKDESWKFLGWILLSKQ